MTPWLDGLFALRHHAGATVILLLIVLWGSAVSRRAANFSLSARPNSLGETDLHSISAVAWVAPVLFLALTAFGASLIFGQTVGGILAAIVLLLSAFISIAPARKISGSLVFNRKSKTSAANLREFFLDNPRKSAKFAAKALVNRLASRPKQESRISITGVFSIRDGDGSNHLRFANGGSPAFLPQLAISFIVLASLVLRFAFLANLPLPAYFDSAAHYRLIRALTESYNAGAPPKALQGAYYHTGFHVIAASVSNFFQVNAVEFMLVIGAIMLALLPVPFFFIVNSQAQSNSAALFACLLAGFGFHMPAHLMNWGKYPALMGLAAVLFVFSLVIMAYRGGVNKKILFLLACAVFASALIHSRTLILYALILPAALITYIWSRLQISRRRIGISIVACVFILEIIAIRARSVFHPLFDGYLAKDAPILILLIPLFIFSAIHYPKQTFFLAVLFVAVLACLFIPIRLPGYGVQTLLDRPFAQMFAFIPFSLIGGFGLAGLTQTLRRLFPDVVPIRRFASLLLSGLVLLNAALNYSFYPSACCRFVTYDDLAAFAWLDHNLPPDTAFLIASAPLSVTSFEQSRSPAGADAGIWIEPLLFHKTGFAAQGFLFDLPASHAGLCAKNIHYIYIGGMPQSFDPQQLDLHPDWYAPVFELPLAKIYQISGCE